MSIEIYRDLIKRGEGCIDHMYLDIFGKVTVAVGNMLPTPEDAEALNFVFRESTDPADPYTIEKEYLKLVTLPYGQQYAAGYYRQYTELMLQEKDINALLDKRLEEFETQLRADFIGFDDYPKAAKLGLMDMAFNLGNYGLVTKFPTFTKHARAQNWRGCSEECKRLGISDARNSEVKELFNSIAD